MENGYASSECVWQPIKPRIAILAPSVAIHNINEWHLNCLNIFMLYNYIKRHESKNRCLDHLSLF